MEPLFKTEDFVPALRELLAGYSLTQDAFLQVVIPGSREDEIGTVRTDSISRQDVFFTDGDQIWGWHVNSLSDLFRGEREPIQPLEHCGVYDGVFAILETHVLSLCDIIGDRFDDEMREVYSSLRRRPDGRSTGYVHDYMWQVAAMVLGTRLLSRLEFEAIMARLERSCRSFATGPSSKNYVRNLRMLFDREDDFEGSGH